MQYCNLLKRARFAVQGVQVKTKASAGKKVEPETLPDLANPIHASTFLKTANYLINL